MADTYVLTNNGGVTKNSVAEVGVVEVNFQVRIRPAITTEDGEVWSAATRNVSLEYSVRDTASEAAILAQAPSGVLPSTIAPQTMGVHIPLAVRRSKQGDSIQFAGATVTSGDNAIVQDGTGQKQVVQDDSALVNPTVV